MKSMLGTFRETTAQQWLTAAVLGILVMSLLTKQIRNLIQIIIHTVAYTASEGYREYVAPFGGYGSYLQTQLLPGLKHSIVSNWFEDIIYGIVWGVLVYGITVCFRSSSLRRRGALAILIMLWIAWKKARYIVLDPLWTLIDILIFLFCIYILSLILKSRLVSSYSEISDNA